MWVHVCFYTHFLSTLYLCQKKIKVLQTQYLSKFAALSTHTFCPITLHLLCDKLFTSFIDIEPPKLKCCGCQTNFIVPLGGSFLFYKSFLPTPSLTGGLVMPIRRTTKNFTKLQFYLPVAVVHS